MSKSPWSANPWRILVVHGGIGLAWLTADPSRTDVPAFKPAIRLGHDVGLPCYPMRAWGALLIVIAVLLAAAIFRKHEPHIEAACLVLAMFYTFWTVAFALAALTTPHASFAGALWALGFGWIAIERATPHRRRRE